MPATATSRPPSSWPTTSSPRRCRSRADRNGAGSRPPASGSRSTRPSSPATTRIFSTTANSRPTAPSSARRTDPLAVCGREGYAEINRTRKRTGENMGAATLEVLLSDETRDRLKEVAARNRKSEAEIAAALIEGALAADDLEALILRQRLAQADAGGPFARHEEVLAWLEALAEGKNLAAPKANLTF